MEFFSSCRILASFQLFCRVEASVNQVTRARNREAQKASMASKRSKAVVSEGRQFPEKATSADNASIVLANRRPCADSWITQGSVRAGGLSLSRLPSIRSGGSSLPGKPDTCKRIASPSVCDESGTPATQPTQFSTRRELCRCRLRASTTFTWNGRGCS